MFSYQDECLKMNVYVYGLGFEIVLSTLLYLNEVKHFYLPIRDYSIWSSWGLWEINYILKLRQIVLSELNIKP